MAKAHKFKDGLSVVKLTTQKIPVFKEVKGKDWVAYGNNNLYPDYLISLFERSSTNNAIITGKVNYVLGEGWRGNKKGLSTASEAKINDFINNINEDETLNELSEKVALDFELYDGFYLKVVRTKNKKDFTLHHVPFNKMRTNEDETEFYYSMDWKPKQQSEEKTGYKEFPKFDGTLSKAESIYYFRILSPRKGSDSNVYPLPNYIGGTQAIETEIECQNYNLAEIKTGFSAGTLINFPNGIPTDDEKDAIEDKIREKYTGTDAAGRLILNFSDGKDKAAEVIQLTGNDLPERYTNLKRDSSKSIFTSHKVTSPELFGVQQDNVTFGGRAQIAEQYELFYNTYISKRQRILEGVFNNFAAVKGVPDRLMIKPTAALSTNVFSEAVIVANLPAPAIRDLIAERMGIDLSKYENKGVTTQMSSHDFEVNLLAGFEKLGRSRDLFHIVKSKDFRFTSDIEAEESEYTFAEEEGEDISKALDIARDLARKREKREAKTKENAGRIEVLYSYELRHNAPKLLPGGKSRKFCETLVSMTKVVLFSRSEINRMSNEFNTDVWKYKGGWYTNPNTDTPTPQCRHIWRQHVVKVK